MLRAIVVAAVLRCAWDSGWAQTEVILPPLPTAPVAHNFVTGYPTSGEGLTQAQPSTGDLGNINSHTVVANPTGGSVAPEATPAGNSVGLPGTGNIETLLPVQANTAGGSSCATSCNYTNADFFRKTRRSNSGTAMTDSLPASSAKGLVNGIWLHLYNADASANDTISARAGTTIGGSSSHVLLPGRDIWLSDDLANTQWRFDGNTNSAVLGPNNGTGFASLPTTLSNLSGQAHVTNISILRGLSTTNASIYVSMFTNGYTTAGDGGGGKFQWNSSSACTDNGFTCIDPSSAPATGRWLLVVGAGGADLRQAGVKFDGATDNSTALAAAFAWWGLGDKLVCPAAASPALFGTGLTPTMSAGVTAALVGVPQCELRYTGSSGTALNVTLTNNNSSVYLNGWTLTTTHAGGATGLSISQNGTAPSGFSSVNHIWITLRGSDGPNGSNYWTTAFSEAEVSDVDALGLVVWGPSTVAPSGTTCVSLVGNSTEPSVAINFGGWLNYCQTGISVGEYVQGLTVTHANLIGVKDGVLIPNATGTGQLNVVSSSFGVTDAAIYDEGGVFGLTAIGNFIITGANSAYGIHLATYGLATLDGNTFDGGGNTGMTGISLGSGGESVEISGNGAVGGTGVATCISYASTVTGVSQHGNPGCAFATTFMSAANGAQVSFGGTAQLQGSSLGPACVETGRDFAALADSA